MSGLKPKAQPSLVVALLSRLLSQTLAQQAQQSDQSIVPASSSQIQPHYLFIFRKDCWETFFNKYDFFNEECLKYTMSKGIGYAIIVASAILKVPQILKIYKSKSVEGISKFIFFIEAFMYLHTSAYSYHKNVPFSVYGENVVILLQNLVIISLYWHYSKEIGTKEKWACALFFAFYSLFLVFGEHLIPEYLWKIIVSSNILIIFASRLPQILTNFANKSTGQLSFIMFFLSFMGSAVRLATVMYETTDRLYQVQFISSVFLNGIITSQCLLYWNNSKPGKKPSLEEEKKMEMKKMKEANYQEEEEEELDGNDENGVEITIDEKHDDKDIKMRKYKKVGENDV